MKMRNHFRFGLDLPDAGQEFALAPPRVAQDRPAHEAVAATQKPSLKFPQAIWERGRSRIKNVALGRDGKTAPVDPLFQSHP